MNRLGLAAAAWLLTIGVARADSLHLYSYDPADPDTVRAAGPLTFTFKRGLLHTTVLNIRSTVAPATAFVKPADDKAVGHQGLAGLIGQAASGHVLYEVEASDEGAALISAFCPGAKRAWMAFGPLRFNRDLDIVVVGAPSQDGDVKVCRTLRFNFHGEWRLPPGRPINPRDLEHPHYPNG